VLIDVAISVDWNVIKKEAEKILKCKRPNNKFRLMWNVKTKCDTGNNRGGWDHFKITHTVPEQHTREARN